MSLADKINALRKKAGLNIDELSRLSGVPKSTLSKITAGITTNPNVDTLRALASALACSLDAFDDAPINKRKAAAEAQALISVETAEETDLLSLWRGAAEEGRHAAVVVLRAHQVQPKEVTNSNADAG